MLKQYVRDEQNNPIGVVFIDGMNIGWSLLNRKDRWNKELGNQIAINRLEKGFRFMNFGKYIPNYPIHAGNLRIDKVIETVLYMQTNRMGKKNVEEGN